jgi:RNA-binding protein PNO1
LLSKTRDAVIKLTVVAALFTPVASPQSGKTKFTIENATKTRIVLADTRIHILGSFANIRVARDALCSLILGSPPGKVYSKLRSVCSRLNDS